MVCWLSLIRVTCEDSVSEIAQYLMNDFTAFKGINFYIFVR